MQMILVSLVVLLASTHFQGVPVVGQDTKYERFREWSDKTGNYKTQARMLTANKDEVVIEKEDGELKRIPLGKLSTNDQKFVSEYKEQAFIELTSKASQVEFASEALALYKKFKEKGIDDATTQAIVDNKIAELEILAAANARTVPAQGRPVLDKVETNTGAQEIVDQWIQEGSRLDQKPLKEAIKLDPHALDAAIVLALFYEIHEADFDLAQRHLEDAVQRGVRDQEIMSQQGKTNLLAAINNLAVSYVREKQIAKALKTWQKANPVQDEPFSDVMKYNIAKVIRMLNDEQSGLSARRREVVAMEEFGIETGAQGKRGGWKYAFALDQSGNPRDKLGFLLADKSGQTIQRDCIEDTRCILCRGTAQLKCPNGECRGGEVKQRVMGNKTFTFPTGQKANLGYGIVGVKVVRCATCRGKSAVRCPCCKEGVQKN